MTTLDVLDKEQIYTFKGLTEKEKIRVMELMYGESTTTIRFILDTAKNPALSIRYNRGYFGWIANHSTHPKDLSLTPFFRGEGKKQFKNAQFVVL